MMSNSNSNSGSGSSSGSSSGSPEVTAKQGGGPRTPPDSHSADFDTSASTKSSDTPSKRRKPMDRDEEIACLKETIENKDADLVSLSKKIDSLVDEQLAIRRLPEASRDIALLDSIEKVIPNMRIREDRLVAEIAKHEAELSELRNTKELVDVPVPAQGI